MALDTLKTVVWMPARHLRFRLTELPVWFAFPAIGAVQRGGASVLWTEYPSMVAFLLLAWHILLYNDWGGLRRNPLEARRYGRQQLSYAAPLSLLVLSGATLAGACGLLASSALSSAAMAAVVAGLGMLYAHPATHLKEHASGSLAVHGAAGSLLFLMGTGIVAPIDASDLARSAFFGVTLAAGNLVHQARDRTEDVSGGLRTLAARTGSALAARLGAGLFLSSYVVLTGATLLGLVPLGETLLLSAPAPLHAARLVLPRWFSAPRRYQVAYRAAFAASVAAVLLVET